MSRKPKFQATNGLSFILFSNLQRLYFSELELNLSKKQPRNKFHGSSIQAINAFPIALATWEALLNEQFIEGPLTHLFPNNLLIQLKSEAEKWDIKKKTLYYPKFFFCNTFDKSSVNFANFNSLIQIRNNILHYKNSLYEGPENAIKNLRSLDVTYPITNNISCPWIMELFSTECIRFCINCISRLVEELSMLQSEKSSTYFYPISKEIYSPIRDKDVSNIFKKHSVDPNSILNDFFTHQSS
ncbi:MAG: hypothetical protein JNM67_00190 [Bacteroidetes bacterium]|nr:hypothetical protein [Bacteroidota bacterium]